MFNILFKRSQKQKIEWMQDEIDELERDEHQMVPKKKEKDD